MKKFMKENNIVINERFNIIFRGVRHIYSLYFDEKLHIWEDRSVEGKKDRKAGRTLIYMVLGEKCVIERLPFRPKIGEWYWTYLNPLGQVINSRYTGDLQSVFLNRNNFIFRTKEEAEDPKNISRLKEYCGVLLS